MKGNASILIVDDEPINLERVAVTLNSLYELHFARSGKDALHYLSNKNVDLILLDINMKGIDGFEVAAQLQIQQHTKEIPIIYLTSDNSVETIERAFETKAADYISKPFRKKELLARVKNRIDTERLKRTNEHLLNIINDYVAYIKTDLNGFITEISPFFCEMIQCQEQLIGKNINILKTGSTSQDVYKQLWHSIEQGETFSYEIENRNFAGGTNWYRTTIVPDINNNGKISGYVAFYVNIDEKVRYKHSALTDYLTGVNNRAKFESELSEEIYRSKRYDHPLSIILADIDHFKAVNDTYGHDTGDVVLKEFTNILRDNIRQSDILARWGGEEFIILCPNTDISGAISLAEILRVKVEEHIFSTVDKNTASFGVIQWSEDMDQKTLFLHVDKALYKAKEQGRNRVCFQ